MMPVLLCLAGLAALAAGGWFFWQARRTMRRLDRMLTQAIDGGFVEESYDETALSSLETRLARLLHGSAAANRALAQEQAAVKTLISDISHQARTPMANVLLYASLLEETDLSEAQKARLVPLRQQAEKLHFLLENLIRASRLETGLLQLNPTVGPVADLLEQAAGEARAAAEKKQLTLTVHPTEAAACFDPKWTPEALYNLVDNAVKYTPAGGRVELAAVLTDSFCRLDVTDTGPGIPESEQGAIFNRFARGAAARATEGLGIGLYLARQIAAGQGGYIRVRSTPGQGSTFSLYLPRQGALTGQA
nr:HAMP domain-containing sensor histidine kinase [uncultured Gemmiger sp.]